MSTPLLSSPPAVVTKMLQVAEVGPEDVVYDLGCGDGRILIAAVEQFNAKEAVGYEIREDVYDKALQDVAKRHLSSRIRVTNDDLLHAHLSRATVITFYLDSFADRRLKAKLEEETSPRTRIVSHDFSMPGWQPIRTYSFQENDNLHTIYLYAVPESFSAEKPLQDGRLSTGVFDPDAAKNTIVIYGLPLRSPVSRLGVRSFCLS